MRSMWALVYGDVSLESAQTKKSDVEVEIGKKYEYLHTSIYAPS